MGFGEAIETCFRKYVDFKGRASRAEYWWFFLSYLVAYLVGLALLRSNGALWSLWAIVLLAYILPLLAAAVRRLHDTGHSGWWYFIVLVPLAGPIILIVLLATSGDPGPNPYGPPPGSVLGGPGSLPPPPPPA